ncbi:hypothetical protein FBU30_003495 [Linnemannia zychae]|nr:hypothetical protein FBU30_003495 [Linnemannia zychae]
MAQPVRSVDRRFTTTAFEFPGYFIAQNHGVVRGITVRNPNVGKAFVGAFASLGGGESSTYIEMAEKARERAFLRMLEHAAAAGGNGVKKLASLEMTEVMAYGTAVTLVPLQQQPQQPAMQPSQQAVYSPVSSSYGQPLPQTQPQPQPQHQQFSPAIPPKN